MKIKAGEYIIQEVSKPISTALPKIGYAFAHKNAMKFGGPRFDWARARIIDQVRVGTK